MDRAPQQPDDQQGQRQERGDNFAHWVGLADIANHFGGKDQIIQRDKVKADAEFVPENRFRDRDKKQGKDVQDE